MSKLQVIVGGLFGSEGKGALAGFLAAKDGAAGQVVAVRVAGPNAGHSVVNPVSGVKHALRQIPVAAVTNPDAVLVIAPGSEVDIAVLTQEVHLLEADGIKVRERLIIDGSATILTKAHVIAESEAGLTGKLGSTGKGIGAARAERIMRQAQTVRQQRVLLSQFCSVDSTGPLLRAWQASEDPVTIQVEGTQGYGLGLHTHFYPKVTSSDCTAIDFLALAGINPWYSPSVRLPRRGLPFRDLEIWVVFRPYPIRVAGNSGPMHMETSWERLGLEPEFTTVTKKMRRVGQWDPHLASMAIAANGGPGRPVHLALTMADQLDAGVAGTTDPKALLESTKVGDFLARVESQLGQSFELITTSDRTCVDLR